MNKKNKKKQKKWCRLRHAIVRGILRVVLYPFVKFKYHAKIKKFKEGKGRQFLVMYNHQTPFDQFFVGMGIPGVTYYLATEDIFSNGLVSSIIKFLVAPIPIKKQATDFQAVLICKRVAGEGVSIALAPEGNRTYSGKTEYIKSSIVGFAKLLKLPIAIFKIEGGYGVQPRWSDCTRKGKMQAGVSRVIEYDDYKDMSNEELAELISSELYVNDNNFEGTYKSNKRAEYLERMVYVCPNHGLSTFKSKGNLLTCESCGLTVEYTENKTFKPVNSETEFTFKTVNDWYEYQAEYISNLDLSQYIDNPAFTDETDLYEVQVNKRKKLISKKAKLALYGDRIECVWNNEKHVWNFKDIKALSVLGRNKANVYVLDEKYHFFETVFQFKSSKSFNALKYVNFYYAFKSEKGENNVKFLGL